MMHFGNIWVSKQENILLGIYLLVQSLLWFCSFHLGTNKVVTIGEKNQYNCVPLYFDCHNCPFTFRSIRWIAIRPLFSFDSCSKCFCFCIFNFFLIDYHINPVSLQWRGRVGAKARSHGRRWGAGWRWWGQEGKRKEVIAAALGSGPNDSREPMMLLRRRRPNKQADWQHAVGVR